MVIWKNKEKIIYGISYIDHKTKCVFNGSELGKQYSARMILEKYNRQSIARKKLRFNLNKLYLNQTRKKLLFQLL